MNSFLRPLVESGTTSADTNDLGNIITQINTVVSAALGILTAGIIILAIFIAFKFFTADDDSKRKNAKSQLIYAIIGVIVLIALIALTPVITGAIKNAL